MIAKELWHQLFRLLGEIFVRCNHSQKYVVDSVPIPVCDNIRIRRCKLFSGEEHRGFIASKKRYFYGLRVHLLVTGSGEPIKFVLAPGAKADVQAFKDFDLD
jgi:hypothetical protein